MTSFFKKYKKNSKNPIVKGILWFEWSKILLKTPEEKFFIIPPSLPHYLVAGDLISCEMVLQKMGSRLAEVRFVSLLSRSKEVLLGYFEWKYIIPFSGTATFAKINIFTSKKSHISPREIKKWELVRFIMRENKAEILWIFDTKNKNSAIESILFLQNVHMNFDADVKKQEKTLKNIDMDWRKIDKNFSEHSLLYPFQNLNPKTKIQKELPLFSWVENENSEQRVDFSNWYTFTIDGADSRDLDDAISLAKSENNTILLGVHIADVSYFVESKTPIDKEALYRGTSIYLPDRVIPMLPETLSNDLCSLNPNTQKCTLSAIMNIDVKSGKVLKTEICPSIIISRHRGVYEDIFSRFQNKKYENDLQKESIETAFELFEILKKRRKKEGKISFETAELYFELSDDGVTPTKIKKRERNDAHKLIEECMVIANEEVAKWCRKRQIPFVSRVHEPPTEESENVIRQVMWVQKSKQKSNNSWEQIAPKEIAQFLESLSDEMYFFASRMILPKMSKAYYSEKNHWHFGLALEEYSHFTSPIRRYSDLITHRMIHSYLAKNLTPFEKKLQAKFLHRASEIATETERKAESIERSAHRVYILAFMQNALGEIFDGMVSGVAAWWYFIELTNGIEVTVYFPREMRNTVNEMTGEIFDAHKKLLVQVWQKKRVKITKIMEKEWRVVAKEI